MSIAHQLARLTPQSPPIIAMPGGGVPTITKEMVAQAAASLDDELAYHLVMGRYTDSDLSKNAATKLIEAESKRIWKREERGVIRKKNSFSLLVILAHAIYFQNPEGKHKLTAIQKARFCELSESVWHAKWGVHYHDLMMRLGARESNLFRYIDRNIHTE